MVAELLQKYLFLLVLLVIVGIFIFWSISQFQNLPIQHVGKGEKGRFMRYLSCAAAMCGSWNQNGDDACDSAEVISQGLEYDGDSLIKGCRELCIELRNNAGSAKPHYCGDDYSTIFTFEEYVNFSSLDIRNFASFRERVIHKSCYICPEKAPTIFIIAGLIPTGEYYVLAPWGSLLSEGYLLRYTLDSCDERPDTHDRYPGAIWISSAIESKCFNPSTKDDVTSYSHCEFNVGDSVTIHAGPQDPKIQKYWEVADLSWVPVVGGLFNKATTSCGARAEACAAIDGCEYNCPQIFVC